MSQIPPRKTVIVTGTRAEYGILKPVIERVRDSKSLDLFLVVTGMHLSPECGMTVNEIEADGLPIGARVDMKIERGGTDSMGKSLGCGISGMTELFAREKPDIVLILGDRIEAFAGATAGLFCGAAVAHLHGGEVTQGGLDEYMRHAITKLSHLHFAATRLSRERIIRLGENPDFVYQTGTPGLDAILQFPALSREELSKKLGITLPERFALAVQHPVSTHAESAAAEIDATLGALRESGVFTVMIHPNADAGSDAITQAIESAQKEDWLKAFVTIPRAVYCNLLRNAAFLIGNSSSGMIDSPAYGTPVINIGERQEGRERGDNVIDVIPDQAAIQNAIQFVLTNDRFRQQCRETENPYGDGRASWRIAGVLEGVDLKRVKAGKRLL